MKDITDIKIVKTKESENDNYTNYGFIHYEYEVSYKLKSDDKSIDMTDYMIFKAWDLAQQKNSTILKYVVEFF